MKSPGKSLSDLRGSEDPILGTTVPNILGLYCCSVHQLLLVVFLSISHSVIKTW